MASFSPTNLSFRFYYPGTESSSEAAAPEDTLLSYSFAENARFHLRLTIQETAGKNGGSSDSWTLQYQAWGDATWFDVTTSSSKVKFVDCSDLTHGGNTTKRLEAGTGSFVAGKISEDGPITHLLTADNHTEHLFSLEFIRNDLNIDDRVTFRLLYNGETISRSCVPQFRLINAPPTIELNTPDESTFQTSTPTLEFTGDDPEGDDLTYSVGIQPAEGDTRYVYVSGKTELQAGARIAKIDPATMNIIHSRDWDLNASVSSSRLSFAGTCSLYRPSQSNIDKMGRPFYYLRTYPHSPAIDRMQDSVGADDDVHHFIGAHTALAYVDIYKVVSDTGTVVGTKRLYDQGYGPMFFCVDETYLYVGIGTSTSGNVENPLIYKVNKETLDIEGILDDNSYISGGFELYLAAYGDHLYILSEFERKIFKIDIETFSFSGAPFYYNEELTLGRIAVDQDGVFVVRSELIDNVYYSSIQKFNHNLEYQTASSTFTGFPRSIDLDDDHVYFCSSSHSGFYRQYYKSNLGLRYSKGFTYDGTTGPAYHIYVEPESSETVEVGISAEDLGFINVTNSEDEDPFTAGQKIAYTLQAPLPDGVYRWSVLVQDPNGSETYVSSEIRSFTVDSQEAHYGTSSIAAVASITTTGGKPGEGKPVDITAVSQVETSGFKQTEAEIQVSAVSDIAALHLKGIEAGAAVSAVSQVQTERHKGQIYQVSIQGSAQQNMVGAKGFETAIQIEAQEGIQTVRVKDAQADVVIEGASFVDTEAFSSMPQDEYGTAEISAAGATASAGDKSAQSTVSMSSQGQIMTTGIAALLDLGIPQNVQAVGISLSEIQLSWDEVLSADGYEYRFREKVL